MTNPNNPNNLSVYSYTNAQSETIYGYVLPIGSTVEINVDNVNRAANVNPIYAPQFPKEYNNNPAKTLRNSFVQSSYVTQPNLEVLSAITGPTSSPFDFAMKNLPNGLWLNGNFPAGYLTARPIVALQIIDGSPSVSGVTKAWPSKELQYAVWGETDSYNAVAAEKLINNVFSKAPIAESAASIVTTTSLPVYQLVSGIDTFIATNGENFSAQDTNIGVNDVIDGFDANLSVMNMAITTSGTTAAATFSNIGTYNLTYTAAGTINAIKYTDVKNVNFIGSASNGFVTNLASVPMISLSNTGARTFGLSFQAAALTDSPAVTVNLTGTTNGSKVTLNSLSGKISKVIYNVSNTSFNILAGTALSNGTGVTELDVNTAANATSLITIDSGVTTIRTVKADGITKLFFTDAITGSLNNGLNATFNTAGSRIGFGTGFNPSANIILFTGTDNALVLNSATMTGINGALAGFSNLDTLEITDALGAELNATFFGTAIANINLNAALTANSSIIQLQDKITINLGTKYSSVTNMTASNALTTNSSAPAANRIVNFKVLGNADSGATSYQHLVANGVGTVNVDISTSQTSNVNLNVGTSDGLNLNPNVNITGGNANSTIALGTVALTGTYDASAALSNVTATGGSVASTIKGSHTGVNTFTTGIADNTFFGGNAADIFTINAAATSVSIAGHFGEITVGNTYNLNGIHTGAPANLVDFNAGTNTTAVDKITFAGNFTYGSIGRLISQNDLTTNGNAVVTQSTALSSAITLATGVNVLKATGSYANAAAVLTALGGTNGCSVSTAGAGSVTPLTNDGLIFFYKNSTDGLVHGAVAGLTAVDATHATIASFNEIMILGGTNDIDTIDATDFNIIA